MFLVFLCKEDSNEKESHSFVKLIDLQNVIYFCLIKIF